MSSWASRTCFTQRQNGSRADANLSCLRRTSRTRLPSASALRFKVGNARRPSVSQSARSAAVTRDSVSTKPCTCCHIGTHESSASRSDAASPVAPVFSSSEPGSLRRATTSDATGNRDTASNHTCRCAAKTWLPSRSTSQSSACASLLAASACSEARAVSSCRACTFRSLCVNLAVTASWRATISRATASAASNSGSDPRLSFRDASKESTPAVKRIA